MIHVNNDFKRHVLNTDCNGADWLSAYGFAINFRTKLPDCKIGDIFSLKRGTSRQCKLPVNYWSIKELY